MKGIVLAGGAGSRLYPLTLVASKQLQPVYDKPMVYYPLATLIENGICDICVICTPEDLPRFRQLLAAAPSWGVSIEFREQPRPEGIAQAFIIAESFIGGESVALILGDNIFSGVELNAAFDNYGEGALVFAYRVHNPERYGVIEFSEAGHPVSVEEKPAHPKSNYVLPGLYVFDNQVVSLAKKLRPSARGELEITDVIAHYLRKGQLQACRLNRGSAWLDAGTSSTLHAASAYVQTIEERQGIKIGCPEEAAFRRGFLPLEGLELLAGQMPACEYRDYLGEVVAEARRLSKENL